MFLCSYVVQKPPLLYVIKFLQSDKLIPKQLFFNYFESKKKKINLESFIRKK